MLRFSLLEEKLLRTRKKKNIPDYLDNEVFFIVFNSMYRIMAALNETRQIKAIKVNDNVPLPFNPDNIKWPCKTPVKAHTHTPVDKRRWKPFVSTLTFLFNSATDPTERWNNIQTRKPSAVLTN